MPKLDPTGRFTALYAAHVRPLLGYALRRVARPEDAADVVAETFAVAWRRIDEVPGDPDARPWLFGVARRTLANHHRARQRRDRLGARLAAQLAEVEGLDWEARLAQGAAVRAALDRLDPDDRELLTLTSWEGFAPGQIAVAMGIPAPTVRSRLHRARDRLRQQLASAGITGERSAPAGHVGDDGQPLVGNQEEQR